jgi:hypothetical protein
MRIFGRFLYALLAVGLFLLTFTYSIDLTANRFYNEVFGESLTNKDSTLPEFYYFYTSIPDFHQINPIISINQQNYQIRGYEVATANVNDDNEIVIEESIYWIVYSETEDLSKLSAVTVFENQTENSLSINLVRFKTLNLLNGVNSEGNVYISKNLFLNNNFDKISLTDKSDNTIIIDDFTVNENDFIIKKSMESFFQVNNRIPEELDLDEFDNKIGIRIIHLNQDQILDPSILIKGMTIYFVSLILVTYLVFFRKRKYD